MSFDENPVLKHLYDSRRRSFLVQQIEQAFLGTVDLNTAPCRQTHRRSTSALLIRC